MNVQDFESRFEAICTEVRKVLIGQDDVVEHVLIAICAQGHVLIEGVPGLGKTLLVRTLGHVLNADFRRIQFTPDLMPSDVTGGNIFNQKENEFVFLKGPIFTQLLLADEVNRAPAKTQSALLEAMQERSVTVDGTTRPLPTPYLVIATQNPVENQGTYPLPEAQLDRFLLKLDVLHPTQEAEEQLLHRILRGFDPTSLESAGVTKVASAADILDMQRVVGEVQVDRHIVHYIAEIVGRTRNHSSIYLGASPRASIGILNTARAFAARSGRDYVVPDDVKEFAPAVLRHRLLLHPDAELEGVTANDCIRSILSETPVPKNIA